MTVFLEGFFSGGFLLIGLFLGVLIVVGLFASLPFGSTSFAQFGSLGGSSPRIYTLFVLLLLLFVVFRRGLLKDLAAVVSRRSTLSIKSPIDALA